MADFMLMQGNGVIALLAEPETEDGLKMFFLDEIKPGELFWGEIPYETLEQFAPGMILGIAIWKPLAATSIIDRGRITGREGH